MREILFRGKAAYTNEWIYGSYFKDKNGMSWIYDYKEDYFYLVVPDTVGQYIGLKDIKGNKLFEGDIFKLSTWYGEDFGIVRWDEERAEFYIETKKDFYDVVAIPSETEIVGNKWDNPELLKEE